MKPRRANRAARFLKPKLTGKNKSGNGERNAERNRKKMRAFQSVALLQCAVKNRESRQSRAADHRAESRAENGTDAENDDAARAARQDSP